MSKRNDSDHGLTKKQILTKEALESITFNPNPLL